MPIPTRCKLGYGLMNFTWKPKQTPDEQAFAAIKAAVDGGSTMLNSGEFYGHPEPTLNLQLLSRFYAAHPEYVDKTYLSVKGGVEIPSFKPNATLEGLRKSVTHINEVLGGKKKMDLFEMARVDRTRPIEEAMQNLLELRKEGHFTDIGLSECSAETIRRAAKVAPIAAVEVEYSPWLLDIERNGVLDACKELNIPVVAYAPLGAGMLTGTIRSHEDIPEGDFRKSFERFLPGNFEKNLVLVDQIKALAEKKGVTATQLCLAWEIAQGNVFPIPGSTRLEGVKEALGALDIKLSSAEIAELRELVTKADVHGGRYDGKANETLVA